MALCTHQQKHIEVRQSSGLSQVAYHIPLLFNVNTENSIAEKLVKIIGNQEVFNQVIQFSS